MVATHEHFLHADALLFQHRDVTGKYRAALVNNLHAVAYAFHLWQDMSGNNDAAVGAEFTDEGADLAYLVGIESRRRFIENDYRGIVNDRLSDPDALPIALGQRADQAIAVIVKSATLSGPIEGERNL